jgi:hypothetical protein
VVAKLTQLTSGRVGAAGKRAGCIFLTSHDTPRIRGQFRRLKAESADYVDAYFALNPGVTPMPQSELPSRPAADIFPVRSKQAEGGKLLPGHVDLVYAPLAMAMSHAYVWIVEYDVDYSGDWANFFRQFRNNTADLLTTSLTPWAESREWFHWEWATIPNDVPARHRYRCFAPIVRVSQRFLRAYACELLLNPWGGHSEFLLPTIALHLGFDVQDIRIANASVWPWTRSVNYLNTPQHPHLSPGTFVWQPVRAAYFHEDTGGFEHPRMLYHPIKPDVGTWYDPVATAAALAP